MPLKPPAQKHARSDVWVSALDLSDGVRLSSHRRIALHFSHFGAAVLLPLRLLRGLIDGDESLSCCLFLAPPTWINKIRPRSNESAAEENKPLSDGIPFPSRDYMPEQSSA